MKNLIVVFSFLICFETHSVECKPSPVHAYLNMEVVKNRVVVSISYENTSALSNCSSGNGESTIFQNGFLVLLNGEIVESRVPLEFPHVDKYGPMCLTPGGRALKVFDITDDFELLDASGRIDVSFKTTTLFIKDGLPFCYLLSTDIKTINK